MEGGKEGMTDGWHDGERKERMDRWMIKSET